jgi:hypothetical protein
MIHHAVHSARPDANCVAHSHSIYGRTFCALGRPLDMITQDSCAFYNDIALYSSFRGIVLESDEGDAIASALGDKKAALLQNHGLLTCGKTIEATVFWFMSLEKCCHSQLMADAAAGGRGGAVSTFAILVDLFLTVFRLSRFTMKMLLTLIKRTFNFPAPVSFIPLSVFCFQYQHFFRLENQRLTLNYVVWVPRRQVGLVLSRRLT